LAGLGRIVERVIENGLADEPGRLLQAILFRESIVTTGIGGGIAIPHADVPGLEKPRLALAVYPDGLDFDALDEDPVHVVFLLLGTPGTPGLHMKILARIARLSKDPGLREGLRTCSDPDEAVALIWRIEANH